MVRTSVVLDDELIATAKMLEINVSDVCRRALNVEIRERMARLQDTVAAATEAQEMLQRLNGRLVGFIDE